MDGEPLQRVQERGRQVVLPAALAARHQHPRLVHATACRDGPFLDAVSCVCRMLVWQTWVCISLLFSLTYASFKTKILYWVLDMLSLGIHAGRPLPVTEVESNCLPVHQINGRSTPQCPSLDSSRCCDEANEKPSRACSADSPPESSAVTSSSSCSSLMAAIPLGLPRKDAIACRCRLLLPAAAAAKQAWAGGKALQTCSSTASSCAFSRGASAGGSGLQIVMSHIWV